MQSQEAIAKKAEALPLPWGFGTMSWHGQKWWIIWRDVEGKTHWENSGTADPAKAQQIMAGRALPRALSMVDLLTRIANGRAIYQTHGGADGAPAVTRRRGGTGRKAAGAAKKGKSAKKRGAE